MKKLLTVSLVAMMAVSAARADIASTDFVTKQTGDITGLTTTNKTSLTAAVNEVVTSVSGVKATADAAATKTELQELTSTVGSNKTAADKTQEDLEALAATVEGLQGTGDQAAATKGQLNALTQTVTENETDIEGKMTALSGRVDTAEGEIDALQTSLAAGGATATAIADAKKAGTDAQADLDAYKTTVSSTYATQAALTQGLGEKQDTITAGSIAKTMLADGVQTSLGKADSAVQSVGTGSENGTISVDGTDVSVKGLGTAAYANTGAFDAAGAASTAKSEAIADAASKYQDKNYLTSQSLTPGQDNTKYYTSVKYVEDKISAANSSNAAASAAASAAAAAAQTTADNALAKAEANEDAIDALGALADKSTITTADIDAKAVTLQKLADDVQASLGKADSAVQSVGTGTGNGNISVDGTQVPVSGLKSAAFVETTAFDASGTAATAKSEAIAAAKSETESQISALGLTAVSRVALPTACENGTATCALVYDSENETLKWEAIMK